jgi:hypothetical protein
MRSKYITGYNTYIYGAVSANQHPLNYPVIEKTIKWSKKAAVCFIQPKFNRKARGIFLIQN